MKRRRRSALKNRVVNTLLERRRILSTADQMAGDLWDRGWEIEANLGYEVRMYAKMKTYQGQKIEFALVADTNGARADIEIEYVDLDGYFGSIHGAVVSPNEAWSIVRRSL